MDKGGEVRTYLRHRPDCPVDLVACAYWTEVVWVDSNPNREWKADQDRPGKYIPKSKHELLDSAEAEPESPGEGSGAPGLDWPGLTPLKLLQEEAEALVRLLCPERNPSVNPYPDRGNRYSAILGYFGVEGLGNRAA